MYRGSAVLAAIKDGSLCVVEVECRHCKDKQKYRGYQD